MARRSARALSEPRRRVDSRPRVCAARRATAIHASGRRRTVDVRITSQPEKAMTEVDIYPRLLHGDPRTTGPRPFGDRLSPRCAVTVIIPAYNEEARLPVTLPRLLADGRWPAACELLVVDDGSPDRTVQVARELLDEVPNARVLQLPWHAGKGAAVRLGVASAHGPKVIFMDADLATDLSALPDLIDALDRADVAVGSRAHPEALVTGRSAMRELLHEGFRSQARQLSGISTSDPQCGFKGFRTDAGKVLFHLARTDGFAFDVEILDVGRAPRHARRRGAGLVACRRRQQGSCRPPQRDDAREILRARMRHGGKLARVPT